MATRRRSLPPSLDDKSRLSTQALSGLIPAWREGDPAARAELTPFLRSELRRQVRRFIGAAPAAGIDATAVVEETLSQVADQGTASWPHRAHLLAAAAPLLRRILVVEARAAAAEVSITRATFDGRSGRLDLFQVDEALLQLSEQDPHQGRIAELRLFGGLSVAEIAEVLSMSASAVRREWNFARAWIYRRVGGSQSPAGTPPRLRH